MQVLTDGGGIYITFCRNLVLRGNFVSDISKKHSAGTCAYYLDELTNNSLVEGNLAVNVQRPVHMHLCDSNIIRNNIFIVETEGGRITMPKCREITIEKNVFIANGDINIMGMSAIGSAKDNILYSHSGGKILSRMIQGSNDPLLIIEEDQGFLNKDPLITAFKTGKVEFNINSPALELGIFPLDVTKAGINR
jgi:hypothetical protein